MLMRMNPTPICFPFGSSLSSRKSCATPILHVSHLPTKNYNQDQPMPTETIDRLVRSHAKYVRSLADTNIHMICLLVKFYISGAVCTLFT